MAIELTLQRTWLIFYGLMCERIQNYTFQLLLHCLPWIQLWRVVELQHPVDHEVALSWPVFIEFVKHKS